MAGESAQDFVFIPQEILYHRICLFNNEDLFTGFSELLCQRLWKGIGGADLEQGDIVSVPLPEDIPDNGVGNPAGDDTKGIPLAGIKVVIIEDGEAFEFPPDFLQFLVQFSMED